MDPRLKHPKMLNTTTPCLLQPCIKRYINIG
jgi:hypothetical protein